MAKKMSRASGFSPSGLPNGNKGANSPTGSENRSLPPKKIARGGVSTWYIVHNVEGVKFVRRVSCVVQ